MSYTIRYTTEALEDLDRLYDYLVAVDISLAERAYEAIQQATKLLENFPFSCRKVSPENAMLRELVVPFGATGYVVLFRIDNSETVTVAAVRHQREDDYH